MNCCFITVSVVSFGQPGPHVNSVLGNATHCEDITINLEDVSYVEPEGQGGMAVCMKTNRRFILTPAGIETMRLVLSTLRFRIPGGKEFFA